ncbi:S8 family serine peptidase [Actinoplanes sp. NPDC051470]|uniref:S8 family serine peptidase n=1 Tax=Actinoplanes sp. NPDC051470 TaxID=3157224 RepID=UPI00343EF8D6
MQAGFAVLSVLVAGLLAAPSPAPEPAAAEARVVTLISGDQVRVASDGRTAGRVAGGARSGVALLSRYVDGRLSVLPVDALPLLNDDRLDPRLFDVTGLLAAGYDDRRADLPLIVTYSGRAAMGPDFAGAPARELAALDGSAVRVPHAQKAALWSALVRGTVSYRKVWLDALAEPQSDVSIPLVGAPAAWAEGLTGGGVRVAVLDTGVDVDHPDLAGVVAETADFTGTRGDGTVDRSGHGTHVASILAGSGAASAGRYRGMAPDARLYSATVCSAGGCPESAILDGMSWAVRDRGAKVVNLSLGEPDTPGADLLEEAVEKLTSAYGALFVAAAGNEGRVLSPASAPSAVSVGASTEDDELVRAAEGRTDLVAPGVDITAARSGDSALPGSAYSTLSGTSAAAPHVAGAAAILAQQHPEWAPGQIKAALIGSATPLRGGVGRLDVAKAIATATVPSPAFPVPPPAATAALAVDFRDRGGVATRRVLAGASDGARFVDLSRGGIVAVPPGRWRIDAAIAEADGTVTLLRRSGVTVTAASTGHVTLDARAGRTAAMPPPRPDATPAEAAVTLADLALGVQTASSAQIFTATPGPAVATARWTAGGSEWSFRSTEAPLRAGPVRFEKRAGGALAFTTPLPATFRLDVSYDDGATWRRPFYTRVGDRGVAYLKPPAGAAVSLRTTSADGRGNEVRQTLLRAYPGS